jgi:hypothetical protein
MANLAVDSRSVEEQEYSNYQCKNDRQSDNWCRRRRHSKVAHAAVMSSVSDNPENHNANRSSLQWPWCGATGSIVQRKVPKGIKKCAM